MLNKNSSQLNSKRQTSAIFEGTACASCSAGYEFDTKSTNCKECGANKYQSQTGVADVSCSTCRSACGNGLRETTACTTSSNRECTQNISRNGWSFTMCC